MYNTTAVTNSTNYRAMMKPIKIEMMRVMMVMMMMMVMTLLLLLMMMLLLLVVRW